MVEQPGQTEKNRTDKKENKDRLSFLLPYINIMLFTTILFIVVYKIGLQEHIRIIQGMMFASILFLLAGFGLYSLKKGFSWRHAVNVVMAIGFIMRIGYMLYTSYMVRALDLGESKADAYGHAAYILKIMMNGKLPETNWVQFYHPPFFHFTAACVCMLVNSIMNYNKVTEILEIGKLVSCVSACWSLMMIPRICTELKLSDKAKTMATAVFAVMPSCYLMGGRLNNDALVTYFMLLAILYTLRWYKEQSWGNTIGLALAFGFGMMTKTSCGNIALFTGPLMLYVAYRKVKEKQAKDILVKLCGFGAISFILGLWYTVRNYMLFRQPFGYVVRISETQRIYTGDVSLVKRFITFPFARLFQPVYADPWEEYNVSLFVTKSSLFSEFKFDIVPIIPRILIVLNCCMILMSLAAMVYVICTEKKNKMLSIGMPVLWGVIWCSFVYFNIRYPFGCTMDFRYIVPEACLGGIFIGVVFDKACAGKTKKAFGFKVLIGAVAGAFAIASMFMFCLISQ